MLAVPEDEPYEETNPHNGKSQIHMPSVQHRCRHSRAQGGQDQQEGSPALRESLLFDHSRFTSRRREAHSASLRRFFPGLKLSPTLGSGTRSPKPGTQTIAFLQKKSRI